MSMRQSKRKRPPREEKQLGGRSKIEADVFDRPTLFILNKLIQDRILKSVDYPIQKGKEAYVFRATAPGEDEYAAVKIYRVETNNFIHMQDYIRGDRRFEGLKSSRRAIVEAWVKKEFANLKICEEAGVRAPNPWVFRSNVLVMDFLGENGIPDSTLQQVGPEEPERICDELLGMVGILWKNGLVHGDVSEFNVLMHGQPAEPYLIDIGQGVLESHPKAREFLERDVNNMLRYFKKYGVERAGALELILEMKKENK